MGWFLCDESLNLRREYQQSVKMNNMVFISAQSILFRIFMIVLQKETLSIRWRVCCTPSVSSWNNRIFDIVFSASRIRFDYFGPFEREAHFFSFIWLDLWCYDATETLGYFENVESLQYISRTIRSQSKSFEIPRVKF